MTSLAGKAALVTGAGQGIGRGVALALAEQGVRVALVGRTATKLDAVAAEVASRGGSAAVPLSCDVKDEASIREVVATAVERLGRLDILVNNAQETPLGTLLEVSDAAFQAGFASGPLATLRFMRACHPHLQRAGGGVIFNLATSAARRWDMAGYGAYAAVKQAIRALTRAAAAEWGPDGIRVLTLAPHASSPGMAAWIAANPEEAQAFFESIPLRRIGDCERDIGAAVAALCAPEFAYLTGATIPLDGGQANFD